jgi:antitoxin ChpS
MIRNMTKVRIVGSSVMFAIPNPIVEGLGLLLNAEVGLSMADGRLIVEPRHEPRYTLSELMAQCDPTAPITEEDRAWLEAQSVGREFI